MSEPILPVGKQSGICVYDGANWRKAKGDADGHTHVDVVSIPNINAGVRPGQIQYAVYNGVPGDTLWHTLITITGLAKILSIDFVSNNVFSRLALFTTDRLPIGPDAVACEIWREVLFSDLEENGGESSLFKLGKFDTAAAAFSLFLKRELLTDVSLQIKYKAGTSTADIGISVLWVSLS